MGYEVEWLEGLRVGEPLSSGAVEPTYCQKPASTAITDKGGKDKGAVSAPAFRQKQPAKRSASACAFLHLL